MRILAYTQLLESYRSLTIDSLSRAFGVSVEFMDTCVFATRLCLPLANSRADWSLILFNRVNYAGGLVYCRELSRFIASGRLHASIDKVHGIVETNRPEVKNSQCETVLRKGDVLLNSVQRLSKVLY